MALVAIGAGAGAGAGTGGRSEGKEALSCGAGDGTMAIAALIMSGCSDDDDGVFERIDFERLGAAEVNPVDASCAVAGMASATLE